MKTYLQKWIVSSGVQTCACGLALAGAITSTQAASPEADAFDRLWSHAILYKDANNPYLQELKFTGRLQADWYAVDADQGDDSDFVSRRARFGFKAKILQEFTAHLEMDANLMRHESFYNRLTDAYIAWEPSKEFKLTVGKQGVPFTYDGWSSSRELLTIDRSVIGVNIWFPEEYVTGVSVSGEKNHWLYRAGVYSNGTISQEFGDFDATWFASFGVGYDFTSSLNVDKAVLRLDYVYQDPTTDATFTRPNENIISLNGDYQDGRCGLGFDLSGSSGYGAQSDLFGFMVLPSYFLIEKKLQAVLRYTYLSSSDAQGIRLGRYEKEVVSAMGDEYHEIFAGLNYYIYGHKLKLQGGVQYASMTDDSNSGGDYDGVQGVLGIRLYW
jgi:phosphate-selective porin OprO and OprP